MTRLRPALAAIALVVLAGAAAPTAQAADQPEPTAELPGPAGGLVGDLLETLREVVGAVLDGLAVDGAPAVEGSTDADATLVERTTATDADTSTTHSRATTTATDDAVAPTTTTATRATATDPYSFGVDSVEECGETCRDVTFTLTNEQSSTAADVTVHTRIYAGSGTGGELVWEGERVVGDMAPGESYTATERVDLSLTDAYAVQQRGGQVTIQTTVHSESGTVTFTEQRDVT